LQEAYRTQLAAKVVVTFAVQGDLRFLSHRDTARVFARAAMRAGVPVRFSGGFNPHPRLFLPVPRTVGIASEAEPLVVELTEPVPPDRVARALAGELPGGLRVLEARSVAPRPSIRTCGATYRLSLEPQTRDAVASAAQRVLGQARFAVSRDDRTVDIRPSITSLQVQGAELVVTIRITPGGSARPAEILAALGLPVEETLHRMRRVAVQWDQPNGYVGPAVSL